MLLRLFKGRRETIPPKATPERRRSMQIKIPQDTPASAPDSFRFLARKLAPLRVFKRATPRFPHAARHRLRLDLVDGAGYRVGG